MVHRLQSVMKRFINFSDDSASKAVGSLKTQTADLPPFSPLSSKGLSKQIKGTMNLLLHELTTAVLDRFDWQLRGQKKESWLLCLATMIVICMCMEQAQISIDGFCLHRTSSEGGDPRLIQQYGTGACHNIEKMAAEYTSLLLKMLGGILSEHNPFKLGCTENGAPCRSETEVNFVNEIRQLMIRYSNCTSHLCRDIG